ncbi:hypothetical protein [Listeria valentina]|uniref:hypothetical protein n=1 Tax=Listeria valentina TaxID=2705293 RepID=UPI001431AD69|nr:hypothetical protein [Listeria valentina]
MNIWMNAIVERLDTAYSNRFDSKAALIFLNDAYQSAMELMRELTIRESPESREFLRLFMTTRDLFVEQLVDRYPSNYNEIAARIEKIKALQKIGERNSYARKAI